MPRFIDGLFRLLTGEPWVERRKRERRLLEGGRNTSSDNSNGNGRYHGERRREDRRGRGWLRFWNPP